MGHLMICILLLYYVLLCQITELILDYKHIITGESGLRPGMKITTNVLMETRVSEKNADV